MTILIHFNAFRTVSSADITQHLFLLIQTHQAYWISLLASAQSVNTKRWKYSSTQHWEHRSWLHTIHVRVHTWHIPFSQTGHSLIRNAYPRGRPQIWHLLGPKFASADLKEGEYEFRVGVFGRDVVVNAGSDENERRRFWIGPFGEFKLRREAFSVTICTC